MHDLVHDLSLSVSKFDTLFFQENSTLASNECSHIRHLNVGCNGESLPEILTVVAPKLYSLFSEIDVFKKLPKSFTRLRVLKFVGAANICELPDSLGELKHLRYLDISRTSIKALPKSTTKLYNLQTLRLLGLPGLTLPDGLEILISLKHLYFDRKELQPVNIGKLTCLQTLPIFFVGSERGRSIKELGSLNELRGELKICHLRGVRDKQEANGANLRLKGKLCKLIFGFEVSHSGSGGYNSEEVMEGLQPHPNLESLTVINYQGKSFPSWMFRPVIDSNTDQFLLKKLMELDIFNGINCESLPPLGQLLNLQYLKLRNLKKVKRMGNEFYCNEGVDGMNEVIKVFPALKKFTLSGMESLEEWTAMAETKTIMFPCLERLKIWDCPLLKSVPLTGQCYSLEKLTIFHCEKLSKIGDGLSTSTCLKELELQDCPNLSSIPNLEGFSSLENLLVEGCDKLESFPLKAPLSSLKKLMIRDCPNLKPIPSLDGLSSLTELIINGVGEEWSRLLPNMLQSNVSLCRLTILNLPDPTWIQDDSLGRLNCLRELAIGGFSEELQEFPWSSSIQYLSASLLDLELIGWEKLKSLPHQLQFLTALEKLTIKGFEGIEAFPEWLGNLSSLKRLRLGGFGKLKSLPLHLPTALEHLMFVGFEGIEAFPEWSGNQSSLKRLYLIGFYEIEALPDSFRNLSSLESLGIFECKKLMYLPSVDVMRSLSKLKAIDIRGCPQLETRWKRQSGPEWSKISHIPIIYINGRRIQLMDGDFWDYQFENQIMN
ncbi:disease resistance protein RGA2-like [Gossypium arboreum]|uniref:disease resistance protein RGA2-like n=1 Tax=Gossypium arboreum TaxID=29729 RepID=UPI0008191727|nr:disease resistance protein RGA2-like [Gossypium arboreum]